MYSEGRPQIRETYVLAWFNFVARDMDWVFWAVSWLPYAISCYPCSVTSNKKVQAALILCSMPDNKLLASLNLCKLQFTPHICGFYVNYISSYLPKSGRRLFLEFCWASVHVTRALSASPIVVVSWQVKQSQSWLESSSLAGYVFFPSH